MPLIVIVLWCYYHNVLDKTIAIAILTYSNDCSNDCSNGNDSGDKLPHIQISAKVKDTVLLNGSVQLYNNTTVGTAARSNPVDCRHERPKNQVTFCLGIVSMGSTSPGPYMASQSASVGPGLQGHVHRIRGLVQWPADPSTPKSTVPLGRPL